MDSQGFSEISRVEKSTVECGIDKKVEDLLSTDS